jgi:hypothetical protein
MSRENVEAVRTLAEEDAVARASGEFVPEAAIDGRVPNPDLVVSAVHVDGEDCRRRA